MTDGITSTVGTLGLSVRCSTAITSNSRITRQISGYDTTIGVALTRRTTPITLFICDERVSLALELLDPAETVSGLYVEQYDLCLGHLDLYLRLTIGRSTLQ